MSADSGKKRAVLKDSSWIRRNPEEDELVDYDPNPGKVVLGQRKSGNDVDSYDPNPGKVVLGQRKSGNDVDSKPLEDDQTSANSGTSVSSLTKRFGGSQELLNKSSTSTKSGAVSISSPSKPPLPVKNPALKTPSGSSFTARVFSGANTSSKPSSPVKRAFAEKLPEVTASQNTDGIAKSSSDGAAPSTPPSSVTVSSSAAPAATSTGVKSPVIPPAVKSPSRSESVSVSSLVSTSSTPTAQTVITNTKTSSSMLEETPKPAEKPSVDLKLSEISYSSARSPSSPPAVTLNTRYSYQTPSAPLDDLADTLLPTRSGSVQSPPVRSQTQVTTVYSEIPAASPTLRSPLQTLESSRTQVKTVYSEIPAASPTLRSPLQTLESSRTVSSRDVCTVCGRPIAGSERMILEDLKIISHASCFRCAVCHCDLGGLEAGKSLWVYRERVNCANCFSKIRGQWYI
ncbi:sciellin isoform X2 [Sinocyclocheilus grahami]|uniref:sciellin isoform X2 n=1 Tax=Sinocyclocheilus grahami TaxID=75366 RepID=UPI0007ACB0FF|nr:PREDICTED: sciellin-like isoform X2 [Sinocyclocheilus grahami]